MPTNKCVNSQLFWFVTTLAGARGMAFIALLGLGLEFEVVIGEPTAVDQHHVDPRLHSTDDVRYGLKVCFVVVHGLECRVHDRMYVFFGSWLCCLSPRLVFLDPVGRHPRECPLPVPC